MYWKENDKWVNFVLDHPLIQHKLTMIRQRIVEQKFSTRSCKRNFKYTVMAYEVFLEICLLKM